MSEENEEEVTYKVADKRKFNADGSVREGVTLDAPPPAKPRETQTTAVMPPVRESTALSAELDSDVPEAHLTDDQFDEMDDTSDIPRLPRPGELCELSLDTRDQRRCSARGSSSSGDRQAFARSRDRANTGSTFSECSRKRQRVICIQKSNSL